MLLVCVSACVDTHIQIVLCKVSVCYNQSETLWLDSQSSITLGGKVALIIVMQPKEHILSIGSILTIPLLKKLLKC